MKEQKRRLTNEILADFNVSILESDIWNLPAHSLEIEFETIQKSKMDILMKMMLITFQSGAITTAEEVSDILLVEPLFINDLIEKMRRTGMIETKGSAFTLTVAGAKRLEEGIFESEPETAKQTVVYSPIHQSFLFGEIPDEEEGTFEDYRYMEASELGISRLDDNETIAALQKLGAESIEGSTQTVVTKILSVSKIRVVQIPCIEFRIHQKIEDSLYCRVWNSFTNKWDETLEAQIIEKELKSWREQFIEDQQA